MLRRILPTVEEMDRVALFRGEPADLDPAERFFFHMAQQPRVDLQAVADCCAVVLGFTEKLRSFIHLVTLIRDAAREVSEDMGLVARNLH